MDTTQFPMLAKTFAGLEDVLRDELISLGANNVEIGNRMVSFEGDLEMLYRANLCCRTALKILRPIEKFTASDPDELYDKVRDIDWSRYMTADTTFSISSTVNSADFPHSKFVTYRVKDGIVDHFYEPGGKRPSIRLQGADLQLDVHISEQRVTLSLNSSGEPLSKRGYRVEATEAPLNEVLAAGIILKTGWRGDTPFFDPMCGSGTFLIEAALIAANINPGIFRSGYAFEKWSDFDRELFENLYNDDSEERTPAFPIIGADIDPEAVMIARKNIRNARLDDMITVECKDFGAWQDAPVADPGIIVTNPPYSERLKVEDPQMLFHQVGAQLKRLFGGWHAWILGYRDEDFASISLKPSVKFPINNGGLDCTLREYVLFDGSYSDFKSEGGSVHNDTFVRRTKPARRLSDDEWEREARKMSGKGRERNERKERKSHSSKTENRNDRDFKRGYDRGDSFDRGYDRPEKKEKRGFDRKDKGNYDRRDRGSDRGYDRNSRSNNRPVRNFDNKERSFSRNDRGYEKKEERYGERRPMKPYQGQKSSYSPSDRGPRIDAGKTAINAPATMRSRKVWKKIDPEQEND